MYYVTFNVSLLLLLFSAGAVLIKDKDVSLTDTFLQGTQHRLSHTTRALIFSASAHGKYSVYSQWTSESDRY